MLTLSPFFSWHLAVSWSWDWITSVRKYEIDSLCAERDRRLKAELPRLKGKVLGGR